MESLVLGNPFCLAIQNIGLVYAYSFCSYTIHICHKREKERRQLDFPQNSAMSVFQNSYVVALHPFFSFLYMK